MPFLISVVIPTHNPRMDYLQRVLEALRGQTLEQSAWELIVVDNGSKQPLRAAGPRDQETKSLKDQKAKDPSVSTSLPSHLPAFSPFTELDLSWHQNARIVREEKLGLTFARLRGFAAARGELIVMVDDDNVLAPDYLETAVRIAEEHPMLGAFGGKCLPEFEVEPEAWLKARGKGLGLRDRGDREEMFPREHTAEGMRHEAEGRRPEDGSRRPETASGKVEKWERGKVERKVREFPDCAPIGAGMVIRREAAAAYAERIAQRAYGMRHRADGRMSEVGDRRTDVESSPKNRITELPNHRAASVITDRRGDSLASGGDNDICLTVVEEGWQLGYMPQLQLLHLIPKQRMTLDYHKRLARDSMRSFVLMLDQHGIRPWPAMPRWTYPLRVASNWWQVKPWRGPDESISWWGNVGMYEGRAALPRGGEWEKPGYRQ